MKLINQLALTIIVTFFTIGLNAQNRCYWPDGKPFITPGNTIQTLLDSIGISTYHSYLYKSTEIFYYSLSNEPAFIITPKKYEIAEALKSYNHNKFINSYDFEMDLEGMIEKVALDTTYAFEVLGKPSAKYTGKEDYSQYWIYTKYNLKLKFEFQNAVSYKILKPDDLKDELSLSKGILGSYVAKPVVNYIILFDPNIKAGKEYRLVKVDTLSNKYWLNDDSGKQVSISSIYSRDNSINERQLEENFWTKSYAESIKKKYGLKNWNVLLTGKVIIGWNKELCRLSWGEPKDINKTITGQRTFEQWVYGDSYLYFENGKLTTIQN